MIQSGVVETEIPTDVRSPIIDKGGKIYQVGG